MNGVLLRKYLHTCSFDSFIGLVAFHALRAILTSLFICFARWAKQKLWTRLKACLAGKALGRKTLL